MGTLTVRNLEDEVIRRLRIRAAEHGRSAEAEHREILRSALADLPQANDRRIAAQRLAEFRRRVENRGSPSTVELLAESRSERLRSLAPERD